MRGGAIGILDRRKSTPIVIREVGDGQAIVISTPGVIASLGEPTDDVPPGLIRAVSLAMPIAEKVADSLSGRLVRLSDESIRLLRANDTVRVNGLVSGVVRNAKTGQFAGLLTFENANLVASVGSSLPALATGAALQMQLARIEKQLATIENKLDYVVKQGHLQIESRLAMATHVLEDVAADCLSSGFVDDDAWGRLSGIEDDVRELAIWAERNLAPLTEVLSDDGVPIRTKVRTLRRALEDDKAEWWLRARVVAEVCLLRWEQLYLMRRSWTSPDELDPVIARIERDVFQRREELTALRTGLANWLESGSRSDRLLDKVRILQKRKLERLLERLPPMLAAYEHGIGESLPGLAPPQLELPD